MDHFERSQSDEGLLMSVVEVHGNIPVVKSCHVCVEDVRGEFGIGFFSRPPVKEGGISGQVQDFVVYGGDVSSGLARFHLFQRFSRQGLVVHPQSGRILIRADVGQCRTPVVRRCFPGSGKTYRRHRRMSFGVGIYFTLYIHIGRVRIPVHLQPAHYPFRIRHVPFGVWPDFRFQFFHGRGSGHGFQQGRDFLTALFPVYHPRVSGIQVWNFYGSLCH